VDHPFDHNAPSFYQHAGKIYTHNGKIDMIKMAKTNGGPY